MILISKHSDLEQPPLYYYYLTGLSVRNSNEAFRGTFSPHGVDWGCSVVFNWQLGWSGSTKIEIAGLMSWLKGLGGWTWLEQSLKSPAVTFPTFWSPIVGLPTCHLHTPRVFQETWAGIPDFFRTSLKAPRIPLPFNVWKLRFNAEGIYSLSLLGRLHEPQGGKSLVAAILEASYLHHHETQKLKNAKYLWSLFFFF